MLGTYVDSQGRKYAAMRDVLNAAVASFPPRLRVAAAEDAARLQAECAECHRTLPADYLYLREDGTIVCAEVTE